MSNHASSYFPGIRNLPGVSSKKYKPKKTLSRIHNLVKIIFNHQSISIHNFDQVHETPDALLMPLSVVEESISVSARRPRFDSKRAHPGVLDRP